MSTPIARPAVLALGAALLVGCGPGTDASPASEAASITPGMPASDPVSHAPSSPGPSDGSPDPGASTGPVGRTETAFGTIWDGVPEGFPRFRGGRDADDAGPDPASDAYVLEDTDPAVVVEWLQSAMEAATYSTEGLSGPFEDGSYELVSVGDAGCRISTTVTPQGSMLLVRVLYGAACPAA